MGGWYCRAREVKLSKYSTIFMSHQCIILPSSAKLLELGRANNSFRSSIPVRQYSYLDMTDPA